MVLPRFAILLGTLLLPTFAFAQAKPEDAVGEREAQVFAQGLLELSNTVSQVYTKPVTNRELLAAGLAAVHDAVGEKLPDETRKSLLDSDGWNGTTRILTDARIKLGQRDAIRGARAFVIAADGFSAATDPYCGLWLQGGSIAESEAGFGLGFELEGLSRVDWLAYMAVLTGAYPSLPGEKTGSSPVGANWTVKRVVPGGPAAKAGLRPGDRITHLDGMEVTAKTTEKLFRHLAQPSVANAGIPVPTGTDASGRSVVLKIRRAGKDAPVEIKLSRIPYTPESVFGVIRRADGSWDFMLDKEAKIGYVRIGAVEDQADEEFAQALDDLTSEGARGLVLDLRWCPGGYVDPTSRVAGALLPRGEVIATIDARAPTRGGQQVYTAEHPPDQKDFRSLPVLVLVNGETTGGGELIAAALQDHKRATVVGQRTFGKANIMNPANTPFDPLRYRVSTGYSLRPSGKSRHRFPDSKPTDDWGVRPDPGFEIPTTPDLSARLKQQAERQAIRPAGDLDVVEYDDPLADHQKLVAVKMLKEKLSEKK